MDRENEINVWLAEAEINAMVGLALVMWLREEDIVFVFQEMEMNG